LNPETGFSPVADLDSSQAGGIMTFIFSIVVLGTCEAAAFHYWHAFARTDEERQQVRHWLIAWSIKGLAAPIVLWLAFNLGLAPGMRALLPPIAAARTVGGNWIVVLLQFTGSALCVISTCWLAFTFGELFAQLARKLCPEARPDWRGTIWLWSVLMTPVAAVILWSGGWLAIGFAVAVFLLPMVHHGIPLLEIRPRSPTYARAIAKMKFGKFTEAEWEVIHELERREDDFNGWMLLAELYAKHFHDLSSAEQTIHDLCAQPATTPSQVSVALHQLGEWHLKLGDDPVGARRAFEEISRRFPDTHLDRMARLRLQQVPATREEWHRQQEGKPIRLPALGDDFDRPAPTLITPADKAAAAARARQCVNRLTQDPNDVPTREELACLLAERVGQVDDGIEQLELLLNMPDQAESKAAEWLALMASWQLKYRNDEPAARTLLQRIVREHPQTLHAFSAQRRLRLMEAEHQLRAVHVAAPPQPKLSVRMGSDQDG
jgi:tetratricopeptide repeat protein